MLKLKQFVPSDFCLKCLGCCRFSEKKTIWAPAGYKLKPGKDNYICPNLNESTNYCKIYLRRPLDCQLYPFLLVKKGDGLSLGLHKSCCFIEEKKYTDEYLREYSDYLIKELNSPEFATAFKCNPDIAADYRDNVEILADLGAPTELRKLKLKDKPWVDRYLKKANSRISAYNFGAIYIWQGIFDIFRATIDGCLSIFYRDKIGMFMALPPLGKVNDRVINKCFRIMSFHNQGSSVSRIENVPERDLEFYREDKYNLKLKDSEYLCLRRDLTVLSGNKFRHKRASYNSFLKNYQAEFIQYKSSMRADCIRLFEAWKAQRREKFSGDIYRQMLEDSFFSFQAALKNYRALGLSGYVVKVNGEIRACSFGYPLGKDIFCILFEVCDLSLKGISQFIFREFSKKLSGYKYINIMGASDLDNLARVKRSYRPVQEIGVYNIYLPV